MDNTLFASAQSLYKAGDYARAYDAFSALLNASSPLGGGEDGHVLHLMGNCLARQRRYQEASKAYQDALQDPQYAHRGSLNVNLGLSLNAQKRYSESLPYFQAAIDDSSYETAYKAYAAMGNAQLKLGNASDAGTSFRRAALENNNPDPARSLVNLGVCFMALGRPSDAVESYITALEFESAPVERNKTYANLGQAYVATGRMPEAVTAFESALQDGSYRLSDAAFVDLERARSSVEAEVSPDAGLDRFEDPYAAQQQDPTGQFAFDDQPAYSEYDMIPLLMILASSRCPMMRLNSADAMRRGPSVRHAMLVPRSSLSSPYCCSWLFSLLVSSISRAMAFPCRRPSFPICSRHMSPMATIRSIGQTLTQRISVPQ